MVLLERTVLVFMGENPRFGLYWFYMIIALLKTTSLICVFVSLLEALLLENLFRSPDVVLWLDRCCCE